MNTPTPSLPAVAIVVLNWNGWKDTLPCLASLESLDYPSARVLVVDNGSTDDSVARIEGWLREKTNRDRFALLRSADNLGFSGGNNLGLRRALEDGADFIWLLNNDTLVEKEALAALVRVAGTEATIGAVGSLVLFLRRPEVINSAGICLTRFEHRARLLGLNEQRTDPRFNVSRDVDAVAGCSMFIRASALRRVGLLDERYFLYLEDVDICTRLKKAGYRCVVAPESVVFHKQWASIQADPALADYYLTRSQVLFNKKFSSKTRAAAALALFAAKYLSRVLVRSVRTRNFACLRASLRGFRHGLAGRFDARWSVAGPR